MEFYFRWDGEAPETSGRTASRLACHPSNQKGHLPEAEQECGSKCGGGEAKPKDQGSREGLKPFPHDCFIEVHILLFFYFLNLPSQP